MPVLSPDEIRQRARDARDLMSPCGICPRRCGALRLEGETGYCGAASSPAVAAILPHFGEEPPLSVNGGAGTVFFSRCNLRCVYCQNHQISQGQIAQTVTPRALAERMLHLQELGCANVEPVSPSHHLPGLLEALAIAVEEGLRLPVVYNTNGYESLETLELLDGIVDIYLPDIKYASDDIARKYSDADDYVDTARAAILAMHSQVGNLVLDTTGRAVRGLILRHLVLPESLAGTEATLRWVSEHLPLTVTLSLMAQYAPLHKGKDFPPLHRKLTAEEYDRAVDLAWDLGFYNTFVQDLESPNTGAPDFTREEPFDWEPISDASKC